MAEPVFSYLGCIFKGGLGPCDGELVRFAGVEMCRKHFRQIIEIALR